MKITLTLIFVSSLFAPKASGDDIHIFTSRQDEVYKLRLVNETGIDWFDFSLLKPSGAEIQIWRKIKRVSDLPGMSSIKIENDYRIIYDAISVDGYVSLMAIDASYILYIMRRKIGEAMFVQDEYGCPQDIFHPSLAEQANKLKFIDLFNIEVTTPDGVKKILECKEDGSMIYDGKVYREPLKIPRTPIVYPVNDGETNAPTSIEEGKNADGNRPSSSAEESEPKDTTVQEQPKSLILPAGIGLALAALILAARLLKN